VLGILSIFGYFMALNYGETYVPSGITSLLVSISPLFTLIFALFLLKEKVRPVQVAGILLSFGGLFVAVYLGTPYEPGGERLLGVVLLLLGAVSWGAYTVGMKSLSPRLHPLQITGYSTIIGFLLTLPFVNAGTFTQLGTLSAWEWLWLAFLGLACTGLGNFLYVYGLSKLEASRVAAYIYLVPVLGLIWGWLFLDESLNAWVILGAAGVIAGLMLVEVSKRMPQRGDGDSEVV
jgi:drug/metabolite transporter (DMT)-like permease